MYNRLDVTQTYVIATIIEANKELNVCTDDGNLQQEQVYILYLVPKLFQKSDLIRCAHV